MGLAQRLQMRMRWDPEHALADSKTGPGVVRSHHIREKRSIG